MRLSLLCLAFLTTALVEANVVRRQAVGPRCRPLDPATDSIIHRNSDPDCKPRPYPDYLSRCTCSYFVARKADGCPSHYYALCTKNGDHNIRLPQPKPFKQVEVSSEEETVDQSLSEQKDVTTFSTSPPPLLLLKTTVPREESSSISSIPIVQPVPLAFANIAPANEARPEETLAVTEAPVLPKEPELPKRTEPPVTEAPKTEAPKTEAPKTDAPEPTTTESLPDPSLALASAAPVRVEKAPQVEQVDRPDQCPSAVSGCIFDDEVEGTDCTILGNRLCRGIGADYCSAAVGTPGRRVCCRVSGTNREEPDTHTVGCPASNGGCIFSDYLVKGSDCTVNASAGCLAAGADYCGAVVDGKRMCCTLNKDPPPKLLGDGSETCLEENSGCMFGDLASHIDCTIGGGAQCIESGTDYCSAYTGFPLKRVCCSTNLRASNITNSDTLQGCPPVNSGCVFEHFATTTDCTLGGNSVCTDKGSYCSSYFDQPSKRVCCRLTP